MEVNEDLYEILFNAIQEGLILVDAEGRIVDINAAGIAMFNYRENELLGKNIEVLVPANIRSLHIQYRNQYMENPQVKSLGTKMDLMGVKNDGIEFPVRVSLTPFVNKENQQYVAVLINDITEQKHNENKLTRLRTSLEQKVKERTQELKASEHLYKSIARNFPSGVINIFDPSYKYLFAEGQGLDELGIETADLIGVDYLKRLDKEARPKVKEELDKVFQGEPRSFEVKVKHQVYTMNAVPLYSDLEVVDRILVVERNITDEAEAAKKMEIALNKERELTDMKSQFVSMASHEFRTPLSTINSSATLIRKYHEKQQCEKIEKHVDRIKNAVQNLTSILNDFLSFEKLEAGKVDLHITECSVPQLIHETFDEMGDITKPNQVLKYSGPDELFIETDSQLLKNTILNIVSNAIKYSEDAKDIIIYLKDRGEEIKIAIQDFGMGIPAKDQKNLFTRFFRSENVANIEGTGLGLNIVQRYLDLLRGKISFQSKIGEGTIFFINLPKKIQFTKDKK